MKYLDVAGIKAAFAEHLKEYLDYSDEEAAIAVSDFPDPYGLPYLKEEYIGEECIDGVDYEMNASKVSFGMFGYDNVPTFRFYTYYAIDDIENQSVEDYMNARKLFRVDDLNEEDFLPYYMSL